MKKTFGILLALALVLGVSLVAVPAVEANDGASSTMIFEGDLTDAGGGVYTGTIAMTDGEYYVPGGPGEGIWDEGGFDVYAKQGGCAYCKNYYGTGEWNCDGTDTYLIGSDHDAYPTPGGPWGAWYDPDCADWDQYSLELTTDHWYLRYTATSESPMSGVMYWYGDGTGYAAETDKGTLDSNDDGVVDGVYDLGGPAMWDWNAGAQEERIPLEFPGFVVEVTPGGSYVVTLTPAEGPVTNINTGLSYGTIQLAITAPETLDGHTIEVDAGTYVEVGQIVISKNLTIVGAGAGSTIVKKAENTGDPSSGNNRGWVLVNAGYSLNMSGLTLDGDVKQISIAILSFGTTTVEGCEIKNISWSAESYYGRGVCLYGGTANVVRNTVFSNIRRIGVFVFGSGVSALTEGNIYTGKGAIDCLDYGIEIGGGATATITGNTITNCKGVASVDGSTSAGILVTTYYGAGTTATITGNTLTGNTGGIGVGYDGSDTSTVVAHYNNINGNTDYGIDTTAPVVDALYNWWGDASGPSGEGPGTGDAISEDILYSPWLGAEVGTEPMTWGVDPTGLIQDAVDEADSGDTIVVTAGTYDEQVVISKSLTLQGVGDTTIIQPSSATKLTTVLDGLFWYGTPNTKNIAGIIVANVADGSSVTIKDLKVDESLVTTKPAGADYLTGIFYRETGGLVDTVTVAGTGAWSGSDRAYGMYLSAATNTVTIEITGSTITNFDKNGIEVHGDTLTADINHNTITGRGSVSDECQNGVNIGRNAVATVNYNTISNLIYQPEQWWGAGILVYHYVSPTGVSATANGNTITDCQIGIIFNNANASAEGNIVDGGTVGLSGIYAEPDAAGEWTVSFIGNTVSGIRDDTYYDSDNAAIGANTYDSGATLNVTIHGNQLPGGGVTDADGISIGVGGADGTIIATMTNNAISGWEYGIRLDGAPIDAANSRANNNNISGNGVFGVYNGGTGTLDATYNWWGDNSGPYHATLNPGGTGNAVSDYVDFEPWLREVPTVTTQAATGVKFLKAIMNMNYTVGGYSSVQVRFAFKKSTDTEWSYIYWVTKSVDGNYAQLCRMLGYHTSYDFKAQLKYEDVVDGETVIEGDILQFTTPLVEGCFIATAAYGTPSAEQIDVLREFRDTVLLESTLGSQFVALYYQLSPPVAEFIAGNELLRTMVRELLVDPIVWVVEATGDAWRN